MWKNLPNTAGGNGVTLKNTVVVPQVIKLRVTIWPKNSTPRYIPRINNSMSTQKLIYKFHNSIILTAKNENNPNVYQLMDKQKWYSHTMVYLLFDHEKE